MQQARKRPSAPPLAGRQVFTLRPADAATRRLIASLRADGAHAVNLASMRLVAADTRDFAAQLPTLADASHWLFISPAAVRMAARLSKRAGIDLFAAGGALAQAAAQGQVFAPGPGTAQALADEGIAAQMPAQRYDSEGLLELPALTAPLTAHVVIVGAPDGRGLLQPALQARGARVSLFHVYQRLPRRLPARQKAALIAAAQPLLMVSSGAMLDALTGQLDAAGLARLTRQAQVVVASERLRARALTSGFHDVHAARSARPDDLRHTALSLSPASPGSP